MNEAFEGSGRELTTESRRERDGVKKMWWKSCGPGKNM